MNGFTELDGAQGVATFVIGTSTYAIVASWNDDGVQLIDVTDPSSPVAMGSATDGVNGFDEFNDPRGVATFVIGTNTYAIVAGLADDGVQLLQVGASLVDSPQPPPLPPSPPATPPAPPVPPPPPCPAYQVGINYSGGDVQIPESVPGNGYTHVENVVSAKACASLCQDNAVPFFGFGHSSPHLGRCWCKSEQNVPSSLSAITSGHACARDE